GQGSDDVDVQPGLRDLQQDYLPGIGNYHRIAQAYSVTMTGSLGHVSLVSISGYNRNYFSNSLDYTYALGALNKLITGVSGSPLFTLGATSKVSQELRASIPVAPWLDVLLGGFYTHEDSEYNQGIGSE